MRERDENQHQNYVRENEKWKKKTFAIAVMQFEAQLIYVDIEIHTKNCASHKRCFSLKMHLKLHTEKTFFYYLSYRNETKKKYLK